MAIAHPEVTLAFDDGVEFSFPVKSGQTVLEAAIAADAPLLFQCRSGTCSTCAGRLLTGTAVMRSGSASTLTKGEMESGRRLLCLSEAQENSTFAIDYRSTAARGEPVSAKAFIDSVEQVADDVVAVKLELSDGDWLDFLPGQYIQIKVPGTDTVRRYSMSSPPSELPAMELLVRILPGGAMSDYLTDRAKPDHVLDIEGPFGSFFLRDETKAPIIMVAGGTGLAPMMSMLDTLRARPGIKNDILLSFGCASEPSLFHQEALELRALWMPKLTLRVSVDSGVAGALRIGNPIEAITAKDVTHSDTQAYLCGPPGLIAAGQAHLQKLGVRPENIHAEQFVASE